MYKFISFVIAILFISLISVYSQMQRFCEGDPCVGIGWTGPLTATFSPTGCPGCTVTIYYHTRIGDCTAPPVSVREYQLTGCTFSGCDQCSQMQDPAEAYKKCLKYLLCVVAAPPVGESWTVTVYSPSCWGRICEMICPPPPSICYYRTIGYKMNCSGPGISCCKQVYLVSNDPPPVTSILITNYEPANRICPAATDECDFCQYACGWVAPPGPYNRAGSLEEETATSNISQYGSTIVKPNPSNDEIEILLTSAYEGDAVLKLYDSRGSELYTRILNKSIESIAYRIDVSNYINGEYFYKITIGDNIISRGSFVVIH